MAETYRTINTRFWSDGWIRGLNALDRYLFLYLLTNEHVSWCGIYELDLGMMAFESGIDKEDLQKTMLPRLIPKVIYDDGWVFIRNFPRYHSGGINAEKGRLAAIEALPDRIKHKISSNNKVKTTKWGRKSNPLEGGSSSASASASASALNVTEQSSENTGKVIFLFKDINPSYKILFPRKAQHEAARRLLDREGFEKLEQAVEFLRIRKIDKFCPQISTPSQLEEKWAALEKYAIGLRESLKVNTKPQWKIWT